jgi:hypothetical protein
MCWDNIGRKTVARHQSTDNKNVMHLWALAYAAENRVPTMDIIDDTTKAIDLPLHIFHPSEEDISMLREDLKFAISEILCKYFSFFKQNFMETSESMNTMHHQYEAEMKTRSKVVSFP